jgi:hypothetical protein
MEPPGHTATADWVNTASHSLVLITTQAGKRGLQEPFLS